MQKRALITGISGQDGSYLAEYLLSKNYRVAGIIRRNSNQNTISRIPEWARKEIEWFYGDMIDSESLSNAITTFKPTEVYNLAAQSFVGLSWEQPFYTTEVDALGALNLLSLIKTINRDIKYYQASTSEMFGKTTTDFQNENTPFHPRSPYGTAKLFAHWTTVNYRESFDMFACSGILFNHESERRGLEFITKKITTTIADISKGKKDSLIIGNMYAERDWGYAPDYVEAMWKILQYEKAEDFVIATGETHSVKEFIIKAFEFIDTEIHFEGTGLNEIGYDEYGAPIVFIDPKFYRPAEVQHLKGDSTKAKTLLGWEATVKFEELVNKMMAYDIKGE